MAVIHKDNIFDIMEKAKDSQQMVQDITDYLNSFTRKEKPFCEAMSREHRTLQQSFTRLCLQWLEHCATEEYRVDGRNEDSQKISREILELWQERHGDFSPSMFIRFI